MTSSLEGDLDAPQPTTPGAMQATPSSPAAVAALSSTALPRPTVVRPVCLALRVLDPGSQKRSRPLLWSRNVCDQAVTRLDVVALVMVLAAHLERHPDASALVRGPRQFQLLILFRYVW